VHDNEHSLMCPIDRGNDRGTDRANGRLIDGNISESGNDRLIATDISVTDVLKNDVLESEQWTLVQNVRRRVRKEPK
jgi:hypothetical protein